MQSKSLIDQILQWYSNNKDKSVQPLRPAIYDFYAAVRGLTISAPDCSLEVRGV